MAALFEATTLCCRPPLLYSDPVVWKQRDATGSTILPRSSGARGAGTTEKTATRLNNLSASPTPLVRISSHHASFLKRARHWLKAPSVLKGTWFLWIWVLWDRRRNCNFFLLSEAQNPAAPPQTTLRSEVYQPRTAGLSPWLQRKALKCRNPKVRCCFSFILSQGHCQAALT